MKKKKIWLEQIRKNNKQEEEVGIRIREWVGGLSEPLEYKLREEKNGNCEKLYCCGRKSCESCEIFLATFSSRNNFCL